MDCRYIFKENGKALNDVEFDAYLFDVMQKSGSLDALPSDFIFSIDVRENVINKIDSLKRDINKTIAKSQAITSISEDGDPDFDEKLHDLPGYIGVTSFITQYGNAKDIETPIVTPFNEEQWEILKKQTLRKDGLDESTISKIIEDTKKSWVKLSEIGDAVHKIFECVMKDATIPELDILGTHKTKVIEQALKLKNDLIQKYGHGDASKVTFYPELSIESKKIDKDLAALLKFSKGINTVAGTIDLLVIDESGNPHIFDYKTSRKQLPQNSWDVTSNKLIGANEWSSTKKLSVKNQMAAYNAILEQYSIPNATCNVIPIWLDLEYSDKYKSNIVSIRDIVKEESQPVPQTSAGKIYQNMKLLFPNNVETSAKETIDLNNDYQKIFPTEHITSLQVKQFEADIKYYRERVKNVSSEDPKYPEYKFYFVKYEENGLREYCKNEEDLERKLSDYVDKVKQKKSNELFSLANIIRSSLKGTTTLDDFLNNYRISNRNFLQTQFGRYIKEGWELVSDDNLIGMGLFVFQYNGRTELVTITNRPIHNRINLGKGSSLLGRTVEDQYINSKTILPATNGNMEGVKALLYISKHPELFKDNKLTQLVVLNPWTGQRTYVSNNQWITNYNRLIETIKDVKLPALSADLFWDDITSMLSIVDSNLKAAEHPTQLNGFSLNGQISSDGSVLQFTEEYVEYAIKKMKSDYAYLENAENNLIGDQNVWMAYDYLYQTLLLLKGLHVYSELEPGQWMSSGVKAGLMVTSSGYSSSTNFRVFDDVMQQFALEVRLAVEKQGRAIISTLTDFYKSKGQTKIIGGEAKYFLNWFKRTPDGKLDPSFSLKDPNDPDFDGNPAERKALDTWLKTMAELRYRPLAKTDEDFENFVEKAKASREYYQVPLTEAAFSRQVSGLGLFKTIKNKLAQAKELTQDVLAGKTEEKETWRKNNPWELYNRFNLDRDERAKLIEDKGIGFFETNLEDVINQALVSYNKTRLSRKFIPIIDGMRVAMRCNATYGGAKMKETLESFDKLVKSKFYGESIIDETLQPFARWVQVVKAGFSKLALGFSFRSFFRELFQGTWMGLSRSGAQLLSGVNADTYTKAALHVVTNAHKNFSNVSLLQQLNSQYGMANYSMGQIARQRRMNWYGIKNFRSDTMFMTSSAPDFQHRMSILVAKMMGDGCWEAHSLDENGFIKYDFNKDKRFSVYLSGDTKNPEYLDQKANYLARIEELNKAGIKKDDGSEYTDKDPLPMAYLPREVRSIKNFADLLYGHYDDESKSLINDMFLGSMFMQYKTYSTSRVEQWTMTPGVYNTDMLQQSTDPITGEKLYKVHTGRIDEDGIPIIEIKTKKNIQNFDELMQANAIEACMEWKGIPMEGMARSYVKFAKDVLSWNWADFKEKWNNPVDKDNILIGLHDCLLMSLMMLLVTGLFGLLLDGEWTSDRDKVARAARDNGWLSSFTYNVSYGSFQDFPFWQTLTSMFGDFNPSVVTSAKRITENAGAVIMGNKTIFQAVTNTVGAAGDLKGLANRIAKEVE